jgi:hypothetical protein
MIKRLIWVMFIILSANAQAQYKPDVIVLGGSAAGVAAAIQAARSGVKTLLINPNPELIGNLSPLMTVPAFDMGLWKEWKNKYNKAADTISTTDPRDVLLEIIKSTKDLQYLGSTAINSIVEKKNGWEIEVTINGKKEEIKCKILVDATTDIKNSPLAENNVINFDKEGKYISLVNYNEKHQAYDQVQKLYRTSAAAGFGKDSLSLHYIPLGVFIPQEKENLLIVSAASFKYSKTEDLRNLALWINMGQAVGALAAYGPFFDTSPSKASIRLTQGEMFTYSSFLYPVLDIKTTDLSWTPIQKIIASGILRLDFEKGIFNPDENVKVSTIKAVMSELYPRSRIWFIENKVDELTIDHTISLLSFVSGRDPITIKQELELDWKNKYELSSDFTGLKLISKKEFAVLADAYISPFNIRIDFNGYFLR